MGEALHGAEREKQTLQNLMLFYTAVVMKRRERERERRGRKGTREWGWVVSKDVGEMEKSLVAKGRGVSSTWCRNTELWYLCLSWSFILNVYSCR